MPKREGLIRLRLLPPPLPLPLPQATVVAPKRIHAALAQHRLVVEGGVADMWGVSGEDEDEQYARAKKLLTKAAKRDEELIWRA